MSAVVRKRCSSSVAAARSWHWLPSPLCALAQTSRVRICRVACLADLLWKLAKCAWVLRRLLVRADASAAAGKVCTAPQGPCWHPHTRALLVARPLRRVRGGWPRIVKLPSSTRSARPSRVMADATAEPTLEDVLRQCAAANAAAESLLAGSSEPASPAPAPPAAPAPASPAPAAGPPAAAAAPAPTPAADPPVQEARAVPVVIPAPAVAMPPLPAAAFFAPPPAPIVLVRAAHMSRPKRQVAARRASGAPHPTHCPSRRLPPLCALHCLSRPRARSRMCLPPQRRRLRPPRRPLQPPPPHRPPAPPKPLRWPPRAPRWKPCWRR